MSCTKNIDQWPRQCQRDTAISSIENEPLSVERHVMMKLGECQTVSVHVCDNSLLKN